MDESLHISGAHFSPDHVQRSSPVKRKSGHSQPLAGSVLVAVEQSAHAIEDATPAGDPIRFVDR